MQFQPFLYVIIGTLSFIFLGTLVPSLVSVADTATVIAGGVLGIVFASLMCWAIYNLIRMVLSIDDDEGEH